MAGFLLYQNAVADEVTAGVKIDDLFKEQTGIPVFKNLLASDETVFASFPRGTTPVTLIFPATKEDTFPRQTSTCVALELTRPLSSRMYKPPNNWQPPQVFNAKESPEHDFSLLSGAIESTDKIRDVSTLAETRQKFVEYVKENLFTRGNVRFSCILPQLMLSDNTATEVFFDRFSEITSEFDVQSTQYMNKRFIERLPEALKAIYTNCYLVLMLQKGSVTAPYVKYLGDFNYDAHKTGSAPVRVFVCCRKGSGLEFAMYKPKDVRNLFRPGKGTGAEKFNFNLARHLMNGGSTSTFVDKVNNSNRPQPLTSQPPTSSVGDEPAVWNWFIQ